MRVELRRCRRSLLDMLSICVSGCAQSWYQYFVVARLRLRLRYDENQASEEAKLDPKWEKLVQKIACRGVRGPFEALWGPKRAP